VLKNIYHFLFFLSVYESKHHSKFLSKKFGNDVGQDDFVFAGIIGISTLLISILYNLLLAFDESLPFSKKESYFIFVAILSVFVIFNYLYFKNSNKVIKIYRKYCGIKHMLLIATLYHILIFVSLFTFLLYD